MTVETPSGNEIDLTEIVAVCRNLDAEIWQLFLKGQAPIYITKDEADFLKGQLRNMRLFESLPKERL